MSLVVVITICPATLEILYPWYTVLCVLQFSLDLANIYLIVLPFLITKIKPQHVSQ